MEILIVGNEGQLARAFKKSFEEHNFSFVSLGRKETNNNPEFIAEFVKSKKIDFIVNTAAYTQVDLAEKEQEEAYKGNVFLPRKLAEISSKAHIPLIHFSTDYVYSGDGDKPWKETDPTGPLNYYGQTKLDGEKEIEKAQPQHLIFRTCWLYDQIGNNFPNKILSLAQSRPQLKIVDDQIGSPTNVQNVANAVTRIMAQGISEKDYGIYNICNQGYASWFDFASELIDKATERELLSLKPEVIPVPSAEFPTPAKRPINSRLDTGKFTRTFQISLPPWQEGLRQYFQAKPT